MGFSILSLLLYLWLQNKIKAIIRRNLAMETFQGRDKLEFQMLLHLCHIPLKDSSETKAHIHFIWTRSGTIIISLFAILFALPFFMGYPIGSYFSTFTAFPVMWLYTSITVGTFNRCIDAGIITLKYPSLFSYLSLNDSEHSTSTTREGSTENS
jgi:hypothetical protein